MMNVYMCVCVLQSHLTLCSPLGSSQPGSSVHGIFQARMLEWVAIFLQGDLPDLGIKPMSPMSRALQTDSLPTEPSGFKMVLNSSKQIGAIE